MEIADTIALGTETKTPDAVQFFRTNLGSTTQSARMPRSSTPGDTLPCSTCRGGFRTSITIAFLSSINAIIDEKEFSADHELDEFAVWHGCSRSGLRQLDPAYHDRGSIEGEPAVWDHL